MPTSPATQDESISAKQSPSTAGLLNKTEAATVDKVKSDLDSAIQFIVETMKSSAMAPKKQLMCTAVLNHLRVEFGSPSPPAAISVDTLNSCISSHLQSFGDDLLTKLNPVSSPSMDTTPSPTVSISKPVEREVLLTTAKMAADHTVRNGNPQVVKETIEGAIRTACPGEFTNLFSLHGVRVLGNGNLILQARSGEEVEQLRRTQDEWTAELGPGAAIGEKTYSVIAHGVPLDFNPGSATAISQFHRDNQNVIEHPRNVTRLQWLHGLRTSRQNKSSTSVIITLNDRTMADTLIYTGSSFCGLMRETQKFIPPPIQCFHCQRFGHMASACPDKNDPSKLRCARCAANHHTSECSCTSTVKCTDRRTCSHIQVSCANCGGAHKSFDNACPEKHRAQHTLSRRMDFRSPYHDHTFDPSRRSAGRA